MDVINYTILRINDTSKNDSGRYRCEVYHMGKPGQATVFFHITVHTVTTVASIPYSTRVNLKTTDFLNAQTSTIEVMEVKGR